MTHDRLFRATKLAAVSLNDPLPSGVVGRLEGIACVYGVLDDYNTMFLRGCFERTMRERVAAGKVRLFMDHGEAPVTGMYSSRLHVGTVRELYDREVNGQHVAWMVADLFDTEPGREAHAYIKAVQATDGETGLSVGMIGKACKTETRMINGMPVECFTEVPLREISITAVPAVPGTAVTAVRAHVDYTPFLRGIHAALGGHAVRAILARIEGDAEDHTDNDAGQTPDSDAAPTDSPQPEPAAPQPMPFAERLLRYRALIQ